MIEFVLVLPLLMLVLALLFYFGSLAVRVHQANAMARYEVWRSAMDGSGPGVARDGDAAELDAAFFPGPNSRVTRSWSGEDFPEAPYEHLISGAEATSVGAGRLASAWIMEPSGGDRQSRGVGQQFDVTHNAETRRWARIAAAVEGGGAGDGENPEAAPLRRGQVRIRGTWGFVDNWRAAAPHWLSDLPGSPAATEATRDAFLEPLDLQLESETRAQAWRTGSEHRHTLTGLMRTFYLETPRYLGPTVE